MKTLICLKQPAGEALEGWNQRIAATCESIQEQVKACGYAIQDQSIAPAELLKIVQTEHPHDALISLWSDNPYELEPLFATFAELGEYQAYAVTESTALTMAMTPGRVPGMCQVAFIKKPEKQSRSDWLAKWLGDHTKIAIDTQNNFAYRQNVVAIPLPLDTKPAWPLMDAIVEENFPERAMTDREYFFAAEGDPEKFDRHQQQMMQSCGRFIDFLCFDCVPMAQYLLKV